MTSLRKYSLAAGVFYLLTDVTFAIIDLAIKGFIVRGAITLGKLIHTNKYLVGPAMIHAYELESKVAKYPRVLVDAKLISVARKAHAKGLKPKPRTAL